MGATKAPPKPSTRAKPEGRAKRRTGAERTAELSEEVFAEIEEGQRAAIQAVKKFVDTVDRTLPRAPDREGPSRRQDVVDAAMEMADRLVHTQYEFLRKVVRSAGKSVGTK
jgi:hypothetical protein